MPAAAENLNAFDLLFLKALANLKINKNYTSELRTGQKENLCIKFNNEEGILQLNSDYLNKIWQKGKEIPFNVTVNTLNELCKIFDQNYNWYLFVRDIEKFRPSAIPNNTPYHLLSNSDQKLITDTVEKIFLKYKNYEEFEKEIIINNVNLNDQKTNRIHSQFENQTKTINRSNINSLNRIYIELITRKASISIDENNDVISEIYDSWYKLFNTIREEMKLLSTSSPEVFLDLQAVKFGEEILNDILRPHLTKHQARFNDWFQKAKQNNIDKYISPQELQKFYPDYQNLILSLKLVNQNLSIKSKEIFTLINIK